MAAGMTTPSRLTVQPPGSTIPMPDLLIPSHSQKTTVEKDGRLPRTQATCSSCELGIPRRDNLNDFAACMYCDYKIFLGKSTCPPLNLTWQLIRTTQGCSQDKNVIVQVSKAGPILTVFPNITVNLCHFYPPYEPDVGPHLPSTSSLLQRREPHGYIIVIYAHNIQPAESGKNSYDVGDGMTATIVPVGLMCSPGTYGGDHPQLRQDYISLKCLIPPPSM